MAVSINNTIPDSIKNKLRTDGILENLSKSGVTAQDSAVSLPELGGEVTHSKEKGRSYSLIVPGFFTRHFDHNFSKQDGYDPEVHRKYSDPDYENNVYRKVEIIGKTEKKFNNRNYGLGVSTPVNSDTEVFAIGFKNSYYDNALGVGVNYSPYKTRFGDFKASTGVIGGIAYSEHGSYAKYVSETSVDKFTALAAVSASVEHVPSGMGVEAVILPAFGDIGSINLSGKYRFK